MEPDRLLPIDAPELRRFSATVSEPKIWATFACLTISSAYTQLQEIVRKVYKIWHFFFFFTMGETTVCSIKCVPLPIFFVFLVPISLLIINIISCNWYLL